MPLIRTVPTKLAAVATAFLLSLGAGAAQGKGEVGAETSVTGTTEYGAYLAGRYAERESDFRTAAILLAKVLEEKPEDHRLRQRAFLLSLTAGLYDQAIRLARELEETGQNGLTLSGELLAAEAILEGRYDEAKEQLAAIRRSAMARYSVPLALGWTEQGLGDTDAAVAALQELDDESGFQRLRSLHQGLILEAGGRLDEAGERFAAVTEDPTDGPLRAVRASGLLLERQGRKYEARALYDGFLEKNQSVFALENDLRRLDEGGDVPYLVDGPAGGLSDGLYHLASGIRPNADSFALAYVRLSLYLDPDNVLSRLLVGEVLEDRGRYREAIEEFNQIDRNSSYSWQARLSEADSLEQLDELDDAVALLEEMAAERGDRYEPLVRIGTFMHSRKRYKEAVDAFDRALARIAELDSQDWILLYRRGMALERSKQWPRAEKDFLKALELQPDQPYVLNYLGYSWIEQGLYFDRAEDMLRKAVSLRENDGYIVDSLGWVLYRLGRYDEAVGHLEDAVQLLPQDPVINDHLGDAYWRVGRKHEARFQWERALHLEPEEEGMIGKIEEKLRSGLGQPEEAKAKD